MNILNHHVLRLGVLGTALCIVGCASSSGLSRVEQEAQTAQRTSERALEVARNAERQAQMANERSRNTEEMIDRSFAKSMRK